MGEMIRVIGSMPGVPPVSRALATWLRAETPDGLEWIEGPNGGEHVPRYRAGSAASLRDEARQLLPAYQRAAEGPTLAHLREWLKPLAGLVRNPQANLEVALPFWVDALAEIPCGCFTAATRRRAATTFSFWPSPADVVELTREEARDIHRAVRVLRYLAHG